MTVLHADYTLVDGRSVSNLAVVVGADGTIQELSGTERYPERLRLTGQVLLPVCSTCTAMPSSEPCGEERSTVTRATRRRVSGPGAKPCIIWQAASTPTFCTLSPAWRTWKMPLSGITSVASSTTCSTVPAGTPYTDPDDMALQVVRAAADVGLRQVLLRVAYHRAGWQRAACRCKAVFSMPTTGPRAGGRRTPALPGR